MDIIDAMDDPNVFGQHFRDPESWSSWRAFAATLCGLPLTSTQQSTFRECTTRSDALKGGYKEAWLVCGRRAGKSFILATIAVFLACFKDWRPHLGPGERATIMVICADRKQARVIMRYVLGLLKAVPMLERTIEGERAESVDLNNRVTIEIHTASFRTVRGYSIAAALCDEIAFWPADDAADPDTEILAAIKPAMATIPNAMLLCASSPYARRGAMWNAYKKHFGKDDSSVLVWQAPTRTMNPSVPQTFIDDAIADDPAHAKAEYMAEFRTDVESYISIEAVEAVTPVGLFERQPLSGTQYYCFVDPSGGSADSMTCAIAHKEGNKAVLDLIREVRPPFSPESVVTEFCNTLKPYRVSRVQGDRYAGEWPREQFKKRGVNYLPAGKVKSDLYKELLAPINSGQVDLLDHDRLKAQLVGLERRTARGGRDSIDHAPGGHDDIANCAAGALWLVLNAARHTQTLGMGGEIIYGDPPAVDLNLENLPAFHGSYGQ